MLKIHQGEYHMKNTGKFVRRACLILAILLALPVFATAAKIKVCQIAKNNCQEVVNLLYEIFMVPGNGYRLEFSAGPSELVILEPYVAELEKMGIKIAYFNRMRDGGTTYVHLSDGTVVYFDNSISRAMSGKLEDPTVTFENGQKFSLQWPAPKAPACQIAGNDCEDVADFLCEIFMVPNKQEEYGYHLESGNESGKPIIHKPYATTLKRLGIEVENISRASDSNAIYIHLADGTVVYIDEKMENPTVTLANGKEFSYQWF